MIDELEDLDRARYAGPVGWMDAEGNGRWAVALRCAEIEGVGARLYAGVGVVRESDVDAELAETQAKLAAMLGALLRV
jgi:menaquinone-specific isochorismate synthase